MFMYIYIYTYLCIYTTWLLNSKLLDWALRLVSKSQKDWDSAEVVFLTLFMTFCCCVWFCLSETTSLHRTSFCLQTGGEEWVSEWEKSRNKTRVQTWTWNKDVVSLSVALNQFYSMFVILWCLPNKTDLVQYE